MIPYHHLADMVFNTPIAAVPEGVLPAVHYLLGRMRGEIGPTPRAQDRFDDAQEGASSGNVLATASAGVAVIRSVGKLVNRGSWMGSSSGFVSYEGIKAQCFAAENDDAIHTVVMDWDSPGGEVLGCFDCSAAIRRLRAKKRVIAFVGGRCCSAAYDQAASATEIVATRESVVASIGVFAIHFNIAAALEKEGAEPTIIYSGAHKVDANPYEKLPPGVRARLQAEIDAARQMFAESVVAGRPNLTLEAVLATEALTYRADAALKLGLIDRIASFEEVLAQAAIPPQVRRGLTFMTGTNQEGKMKADETNVCATCGANCPCGATCTAKGCGCCEACKATATVPPPADDANKAASAQESSFFATMRNFFLGGAPAATGPDPEKAALLGQLATERAARVNAEVTAIFARNVGKFGRDSKVKAEALLRAAMTDPQSCVKTLGADLAALFDSLPVAVDVDGGRIARTGNPDAAADEAIDRTTSTIVGEEDGNESRSLDRDVRQYMRENKIEYSAENYRVALSAVLAKSSATAP